MVICIGFRPKALAEHFSPLMCQFRSGGNLRQIINRSPRTISSLCFYRFSSIFPLFFPGSFVRLGGCFPVTRHRMSHRPEAPRVGTEVWRNGEKLDNPLLGCQQLPLVRLTPRLAPVFMAFEFWRVVCPFWFISGTSVTLCSVWLFMDIGAIGSILGNIDFSRRVYYWKSANEIDMIAPKF